MHAYCAGALVHVDDHFARRTPSLEDMALIRRQSAGVSPLYHLVEYTHEIRVPDAVFEHPAIRELEDLGMDMVSMCVARPDVSRPAADDRCADPTISFRTARKGQVSGPPVFRLLTALEAEGVPHNMVAVCERNGMSTQQAIDTVGRFLKGRYGRWDTAVAQVPSWGRRSTARSAGISKESSQWSRPTCTGATSRSNTWDPTRKKCGGLDRFKSRPTRSLIGFWWCVTTR